MPSPLLVASAFTTAAAAGILPGFLRSVLPTLKDRLPLSDEQVRRLGRYLNLFAIPSLPLAGWLIDRWGLHEVLFLGSVGLAFAIAWIALSLSYGSLVWGMLALAAAGACLFPGAIVLMARGLDLFESGSAIAPLGFGFFVLGAIWLLTPVALPALLARLGFHRVLLTLALACLIPGALVVLTPRSELPEIAPVASVHDEMRDVKLWLAAAVVFFYFLLERTLSVWPRPYLKEIGYGDATVTRLMIGFWIAYLMWRLLWCWVTDPGYEAWTLLVLLVSSSMILGNLVGAYAPSSGYVGFWLIGACYGPLLPTVFSLVLDLSTPHGLPGLAVATMMVLYPFTVLAVQPWFVAYAASHSARESMRIPMIMGLVMAAPTLVLALIRHAR